MRVSVTKKKHGMENNNRTEITMELMKVANPGQRGRGLILPCKVNNVNYVFHKLDYLSVRGRGTGHGSRSLRHFIYDTLIKKHNQKKKKQVSDKTN